MMIKSLRPLFVLILPFLLSCSGAPVKHTGLQQDQVAAEVEQQEDIIYRLLLAEIAGQMGHIDVSVENLIHVSTRVDDPAVAERAVRAAIYGKDYKAALIGAKRWISLAPDDVEALKFVAALSLHEGDADTALTHFKKLLQYQQDDLDYGFQLSAGLLSREREQHKQDVINIMSELVAEHENHPYAHLSFAELALLVREYGLADKQLKRALELKPDFDQALIARARLLRELNRVDEAIVELEAAVKRNHGNEKIRLAYGRLLLDAKRYSEAKSQFRILLKGSPQDSDYIYTLALLTLEINQLDEAKEYLQQLVQLGERASEAHYYLGRVSEALRDYSLAIEHYTKVSRGEYKLDAQIRIGQLYADNGEIEKGRLHLQRLRAKHPENSVSVRVYLAESNMLAERKRFPEAIEVLSAGLVLVPGNADLLYTRSLMYEKTNRIDLLENDLRAVLLREPENAAALNALGYTLADRTSRYQEAYELIQQALSLEPEDPAIIDSMGWVLYRLGHINEAAKYLRRALTIQYDNEIAAHLGEVLWVMGQEDAAKLLLRKALEKAPDNEHLLNVQKQFELDDGQLQ